MEISTIMNVHELTLNRNMKQRAPSQMKKGQTVGQDNTFQPEHVDLKEKDLIGTPANTAHQQVVTTEEVQAEVTLSGNIVDIHT